MNLEQLQTMLTQAERERDMAEANYHRAEGAISVIKLQIAQMEEEEKTDTAPQNGTVSVEELAETVSA